MKTMKVAAVAMTTTLLLGSGYALADDPGVQRGEQTWVQSVEIKGEQRRCTSCHGADLSRPGKHRGTGKLIEPMAISANPSRYQDPEKVEKWFKRNCKWTWGRECTAEEKVDFLSFLRSR